MKGNGCKATGFILHNAERVARSSQQAGLVMVQVDLARAFNTVPVQAMEATLVGQGLPGAVVGAVHAMYHDAHTDIKISDNVIKCNIKRGVKQGDHLTPLLFNWVMDPLIGQLEGDVIGEGVATTGALAFAEDDLTLLSEFPESRGFSANLLPN